MKNKKLNSILQFIKFGMVGIVNTIVSYTIYSILFHFGMEPLLCNIPAFVLSVLVSFLLNSSFVFKKSESSDNTEKSKWWKVLIKTYISYSFTGLFLAEVLTWFWLDLVHLERFLEFAVPIASGFGITITAVKLAGYLAPIINLLISVPLNFILNKYWAFKKR